MATNYYGLGSQGQGIPEIQNILASGGYYTDAIDGIYGPKTQDALTRYQSVLGLAIDGIVGPETYNTMFASNTTSTPIPDTGVVTDTMGSVPLTPLQPGSELNGNPALPPMPPRP